ncbi:MAG: hypothetical protein AB1649_22465 [Chloroflexota bacterium]
MQFLRRTLAVFLAFLFMGSAVLALFLFNLEWRAFSPATYKQAFINGDFYNRLPTMLAEALATNASGQTGLPFTMRGLSVQQWDAYVRAILPPDVIRVMGDQTLDSIFAYLNQQSDTANVSLVPLKASMGSASSVQAVFNLLATQPPCTIEQITSMTLSILQSGEIAFCNPPPDLQPLIAPLMQSQLQYASTLLPDTVIIMNDSGQTGLDNPRERLGLIRMVMQVSPLIALGVMAVYGLVVVFTFVNWLDWIAVPMLISGFFSSLAAIVGSPVVRVVLEEILARNMPVYFPPIFVEYAGDLAVEITAQFLQPVIWQGLIIGAIGLGLLALSFLLRRRGKFF